MRVIRGGAKREAIPDRLHTVSNEPDGGLEITNREIKITNHEPKSKVGHLTKLSQPGPPKTSTFNKI